MDNYNIAYGDLDTSCNGGGWVVTGPVGSNSNTRERFCTHYRSLSYGPGTSITVVDNATILFNANASSCQGIGAGWSSYAYSNDVRVNWCMHKTTISVPPSTPPPPPPTPSNTPPRVNAGLDKTVNEGGQVGINATASDPDGSIASYRWTCTGGALSPDNTLDVAYTAPDGASLYPTYFCTLTVTDNGGAAASDSVAITVNDIPSPTVICSGSPASLTTGGSVTWSASASGGSGSYAYAWADTDGATFLSGATASWTKTYSTAGTKFASVSVIDTNNRTATASCGSVEVNPPAPPPPPAVTPDCNTGISCSGSCNAPANTCSSNNGTRNGCEYTTYSAGGSCNRVSAPNQSCTLNNCSAGNTCTNGTCVTPPPPPPPSGPYVELMANPQTGTVPLNVTLTATVNNAGGANLYYYIDCTDNGSEDQSWGASTATSHAFTCTYSPAGTYHAKVRVSVGACGSCQNITDTSPDITVSDPVVNGACRAEPDIHWECASPTASTDRNTTPSTYTWTCPGSGGAPGVAINASCSEPRVAYSVTARPGGTLTSTAVAADWTAPLSRDSQNWIAIYRIGDPDTSYLAWQRVGTSGTSGTLSFTAPSSGGNYQFRYLKNDFSPYERLAESNTFTVPTPTVTFWADSYDIAANTATTLRWNASSDVVECFASSFPSTPWTGARAPFGTESTGNLIRSTAFALGCRNAFGIWTGGSFVVNVRDTPPTVTLSASPNQLPFGDNQTFLNSGQIGTNPIDSCDKDTEPENNQWTGSQSSLPVFTQVDNLSNDTSAFFTHTFSLQCRNRFGAGNLAQSPVRVEPRPAAPEVALTADVASVPFTNTGTTLHWSATFNSNYAARCRGSGGTWNMDETWPANSTSGTMQGDQPTGKLTSDTTYNFTCSNIGGENTKDITIGVLPPPDPTLTFTVDNPDVTAGRRTTLRWSSTDTVSCTASSPTASNWNGSKNISGNFNTGPLNSAQQYSLFCTGPAYQGNPNGKKTPTRTLNVGFETLPPSVSFSANPTTVAFDHRSMLSWQVTGTADSCTADSMPASTWSGSKSITGGSEPTANLTEDHEYTLFCTNDIGSSPTQTVQVRVGPKIPIFQEIRPE